MARAIRAIQQGAVIGLSACCCRRPQIATRARQILDHDGLLEFRPLVQHQARQGVTLPPGGNGTMVFKGLFGYTPLLAQATGVMTDRAASWQIALLLICIFVS